MAFDSENRPSGMHERAKVWKKRSTSMFAIQRNFLSHWQDVAEIFYPERADFLGERSDGEDVYDGIYTSEPQMLRRNLSNRFNSMTRTKGEDWFRLTARPEELMKSQHVREWAADATKRQRNVIYAAESNFTRAMTEGDNDYVAFGNAITRHSYNRNRTGVLFKTAHLRDCAWAEDAEGVVNEMHEIMKPTIDQVVQLFGTSNLPRQWRELFDDKKGHEKVQMRRCVAPLDSYSYDKHERPRHAAQFMSLYMAMDVDDDECALAEGYFDVFPYSVRRWMTTGQSAYARSPVTDVALADGRTLNIAEQALLKGIEWKVDPPRTALDDGVVGEIRLGAGEVTYIRADYDQKTGDPLGVLEVGDPRYGMEYVEKKSAQMARVFFMDLLQMPEKEMTLGEFRERLKTILRDAQPVFEPIEAEYALLMEAVFDRIAKSGGPANPWGGFLPPPDELKEADVDFEFQTALADAKRELKRLQYMDVEAQYVRLAEIGSPAKNRINMDAATKDSLENFPPEWTHDDEEYAALTEQDAERAAAMQQAEQAGQFADTVAKANPENLRLLKREMEAEGA